MQRAALRGQVVAEHFHPIAEDFCAALCHHGALAHGIEARARARA